MRRLSGDINNDQVKQAPSIGKLAQSLELQTRLERVREVGTSWLGAPGRSTFPNQDVVTRLAESMLAARMPIDQLRALSIHHHEHGGGRRWFREQAAKMLPLVADTGTASSDYRFR